MTPKVFSCNNYDNSSAALIFCYLVIWICAHNKDVVKIMLHAHKMDMTNGDFVFLYYTRNPLDKGLNLRIWEVDAPENMTAAERAHRRQAFYPIKMVICCLKIY